MAKPEFDRLLKEKRSRRLTPAPVRDPIPESVGVVIPIDTSETPGEGAIASPLTETGTVGTQLLTSSDGLFAFEYPQETDYDDDNGVPVKIIHA